MSRKSLYNERRYFVAYKRLFSACLERLRHLSTNAKVVQRDGAVVQRGRESDFRLAGRGFDSQSGRGCVTTNDTWQVVHTLVPLLPGSIIMAAMRSRCEHYIFVSSCGFFFLLLLFLPSCEFRMHV